MPIVFLCVFHYVALAAYGGINYVPCAISVWPDWFHNDNGR